MGHHLGAKNCESSLRKTFFVSRLEIILLKENILKNVSDIV